MTGRTKRSIGIVLAIVVIAGGAWWLLRGRGGEETTFRFASVERGNLQSTVSATGALSAVKTVQVGTQVSGQVAEIHADFNDHVKKGQLLARIDPTLQKQAVQDAQANLEKARAQLLQAKQEYDRNQPLYAQKYITGSEFGTVQVNLSVGQAGVKSAQIALDKANQNLSLTNIYAPIDGVIVERDVDVGQTVAASLSAPQLFLLAQDLSQMQILAAVDESDIGTVKEGQGVNFTVQSYQGRTFKGSVSQVRLQSKTTDNVVSYTVVVTVDNVDGKLLPGMTATVEFITGSANGVLLVPNAALRFRPSADLLAASGLPATIDTTRHARPGTGASASAAGGALATPPTAPVAQPSAGGGAVVTGGAGANRPRRAGSGGSFGGIGTLWTLDPNKKLKSIRVRIGLTDGLRTQVTSDSLTAGMQVIVGATTPVAPPTATANPLAPQQQGRGRGGP